MGYIKKFIFLLTVLLFFSNSAYAYLDPGTGSFIIQGLIAGFVGGLYALKIYWKKIKSFFSKTSTDKLDEEVVKEQND